MGMQLVSTWKSGHYLVESDPGLASFKPEKKLAECEQHGTDLLNPFGMGTYKEMETDEPDPMLPQPLQEALPFPMVQSLELEGLINNECTHQNGLESVVEVADGKNVHKARVLCEFTKYTRVSNSTDCLRWVANISCFAPPPVMLSHHIRDESIMETDHILVQDPVTVLLCCEGIPFLGMGLVNLIKVDKCPQSIISKDLLNEEMVVIGVQILCLKPSNAILPDGKESDWNWNHGYSSSVSIPGKCQEPCPELF